VDASARIGVGHLMRCLTLAEALRQRGADVRFVCRTHQGHRHDEVRARRFPLAELPAPARPTQDAADADYEAWLGVAPGEDARETEAALGPEKPDWLVVDHYALGADWERALRPRAAGIFAIDDRDDCAHDCDMLLNQNFSLAGPERYVGRVPESCRLLLGPRCALLREEFAVERRRLRPRDGRVRRVFVSFGGTDPGDVTGRALGALSSPEFAALAVDVLVGANYCHRERLESMAAGRPGTLLHGPLGSVARMMASADLAIGAGGGTTWERLCLGLPSVVVSIAENQVPSSTALAERRLVRYLGRDAEVGVDAIRRAVTACLDAPDELRRLSADGEALVDGRGASRVAECLAPLPAARLRLRPAQPADARLFHEWVNDAEVRRQSLRTEHVDWPAHLAWFEARLADGASRLFVLEAGDLPVGQIRFEFEGREARINYSVDALFRGRGWGRALVVLGMRALGARAGTSFRAEVKDGNPASSAVFRSLGFDESAATGGDNVRVFRRAAAAT
jgi:UDP-2,4-diacetamido-2,4,6-trideoxy-beta-L-altropyranose hydrolase